MNNKSKGSVLIVDDNIINLKVLFNYLEKSNFKVLIAEKGSSALKRVHYIKPDMILLDIRMPDMDGFEVCRRLKEDSASKNIPVIFMTAQTDAVDKVKGFELGAVDYITKPVQVEDVLIRITTHLTICHLQQSLLEKNELLKQEVVKYQYVEGELRKFSRAVEQSGNAILITNIKGYIEFVNPTFSFQTGYTEEEVLGQNPRILKSGKQSKDFYQKMWTTLHEGHVWKDELLNKRKNGELYWALDTISPIKDKMGEITHYISIQEDISERKKAEIKLEEAIKTSETAKIEAETANHAKSAFLANMSHELRTPLNGILGYTQILHREHSLSTKQKDNVQIIQRCGEHLLILINDILDLSKIEASKLELIPKDFFFSGFLKDIIDLFIMRATQKEIKLVYEPTSQLPVSVHADEKRLRQVLLNLLSNAIKFTQEGSVVFTVHYASSSCYFDIKDSGKGIASDHLEQIFLPFQQVADQSYQEGTGLGLSISKRLVTLMGGTLQVESTLNSGSRFWFKIPLPECQSTQTTATVAEAMIIGVKSTTVFKVLVVDDTADNRMILSTLLTPLGFDVLEAYDGQDALIKAEQSHPDIIIMDIKMPIMDGLECTRRLRQQAPFEKTIIIALSATVFESERKKSLDVGCNAFLEKPINTNILLSTLGQYCDIEWIYETEESVTQPIIFPTDEQIQVFLESAQYGDVQAVIKEAESLLKKQPQLEAFVQEVCQLAKSFKITQLKKFLKQE